MADDLFRALEMFNQGSTQLATGRAIRNASEQAQQINLMEEDEFKKRQAFTSLGQGLAAQLSSYGASPSQVQQMSANFMPQQMNSPQDFFAASQMATSPQAQQQYAKAGQGMQSQIASAPLTKQQIEQNRLGWASLIGAQNQAKQAGRDKLAEEVAKRQVPDFEIMPGIIPQEEDVKKLKGSNASRLALLGNIGRLEKLVGKEGTELFSITGDSSRIMHSIYKSALSELRTMEELGVLNKEDIPQLEGILPDPTGWDTAFTINSKEKVLSAYKEFRKTLDDKIAARAMARGYVPSASSPLRKNAVKIQKLQAAEREVGQMESKIQGMSPDSQEYAIMRQILDTARTKLSNVASE